jgi:hypothetical protein
MRSGWHKEIDSKTVQLIWQLVGIACLWAGSDVGYYLLLPAFGIEASYNTRPVSVALYYGFWAVLAVITFRSLFNYWSQYAKWPWFEMRIDSFIIWSFALVGPLLFVAFVLPMLPSIGWNEPWSPPEIRVANGWYFLPKSIEIVFQQLLIVALVLALAARQHAIGKIMAYSAAIFGGAHMMLVFADVPLGYVIRFVISAAVFGLIFPYFILRLRNGLAYSYMVHWLYYLATVTMPHLFWHPGK